MSVLRSGIPVLAAFLSGAALAQPTFSVTSLVDGHAASLRAALAAAASTPTIIELRVAGNYVLDPGRGQLPPVPTGTLVQAVGFAAGQRFTIDARSFAGGVVGLRVPSTGARITAPLTIRVNVGSGVVVTGNGVRLADVEVASASSWCFRAENIQDLLVDRLVTAGSTVGVSLFNCRNSRLGNAGSGQPVQATGCRGQGILLQQCTDVTLEHFVTDDNVGTQPVTGLLVQDCVRVVLGMAGRRSSSSRNSAEGVKLERCTDCRVQSADLSASRLDGCRIDGGSGNVLTGVTVVDSGGVGVQVAVGAARITLGPQVRIDRPAGGLGPCVALSDCIAVRLEGVECTNGAPGVSLGLGAVDAVLDGCHLHACRRGLHAARATDLRVLGSRIEGNTLRGIELDESTDVVMAGCRIEGNFGPGLEAVNGSDRLTFGPGNVVERNGLLGLGLRDSDDCLIADNPSISHNSGSGIDTTRSRRLRIQGNTLVGNMGVAIWLTFDSSGATIGPDNEIRGTYGAGIKLEVCNDDLITGNRIVDNFGIAIGVIEQATASNRGHVVRSTLIAGNRNVGVLMRGGNPLTIEASTIAGNYRGLQATSDTQSPAIINVDSSILWGNALDDYDNESMDSGIVVPQHSTVQRPPGTGTNNALDPRFVQPASGDYRLTADSPALGAANQQRYAGLGIMARDSQNRDRIVDCAMDLGACEFQRIDLAARVGTRAADFTMQWPRSLSGSFSALLFGVTPPAGGVLPCSSFVPDPFTPLQFSLSYGMPGVFVPVPGDGVVRGNVTLMLPGPGPWQVWATGLLLDGRNGTLVLRGISGTATVVVP